MMRMSVITDEISQDFGTALELAKRYGLEAVEARSVWERGAFEWTRQDVDAMRRALDNAELVLCCIGSPFYKCELDSPEERKEQIEGLTRTIGFARELGVKLIRGFSFWDRGGFAERLEDIAQAFREPACLLGEAGMTMVLESDPSVHTTNAAKLVKVIEAVDSPHIRGLWDPGNDLYDPDGEVPFPDGYEKIRPYMAHMHLKDAAMVNGKPTGVPVGTGDVDLEGQFRRLLADGYSGFVSLETHYRHTSTLSEETLAMPKGSAFSRGGYEATEESLALWRKLMERIEKGWENK